MDSLGRPIINKKVLNKLDVDTKDNLVISGDVIFENNVTITGVSDIKVNKIETGTSKIEIDPATLDIITTIENNVNMIQDYKTFHDDHVVFHSYSELDSNYLFGFGDGAIYTFPFVSKIDTTSPGILSIKLEMEYKAAPQIFLRVLDVADQVIAQQDYTLPTNATFERAFVEFNLFETQTLFMTNGSFYKLELSQINVVFDNPCSLYGAVDPYYGSGATALNDTIDGNMMPWVIIRGEGNHPNLLTTKINGVLSLPEIDNVGQTLLRLTSSTGHHKLQSLERDTATTDTLDTHIASKTVHGVFGDVVGTSGAQNLTDKTLTTPIINSFTTTGGGVLSIPQSEVVDIVVLEQSAQTLKNKTITAPSINKIRNSSGGAYVTVPITLVEDNFILQDLAQSLTSKTIDVEQNTLTNTEAINVDTNGDINIGTGAGSITTLGLNNIKLGNTTQVANNISKSISLGYGAEAGLSNELRIGSTSQPDTITNIIPGGVCDLGRDPDTGAGASFQNLYLSGSAEVKKVNGYTFPLLTEIGEQNDVITTNNLGELFFIKQNTIVKNTNTFTLDSNPALPTEITEPSTAVFLTCLYGSNAGASLTTGGDNNTFLGALAGNKTIDTDRSTYIGSGAGRYQLGANNTALGMAALDGIDPGVGVNTNTGVWNCALGRGAMRDTSVGSYNSACGGCINSTLTDQNYSSSLGYDCKIGAGANYSIALGAQSTTTAANQMVIGSSTVTQNITEVVPGITNTCSLGSTTKKFKSAYIGGGEVDISTATDFKYNNPMAEAYVNLANTTALTQNIWTPTTITTGFTLSHAQDFTSSATGLTYTGARTRLFHTGITISVRCAGTNDQLRFAIYKNGVLNPGSEVYLYCSNSSSIESTALHSMTQLSTGDSFRLYCMNASSDSSIIFERINFFIVGMSGVVP